jgi:hypothetical protein
MKRVLTGAMVLVAVLAGGAPAVAKPDRKAAMEKFGADLKKAVEENGMSEEDVKHLDAAYNCLAKEFKRRLDRKKAGKPPKVKPEAGGTLLDCAKKEGMSEQGLRILGAAFDELWAKANPKPDKPDPAK